MKVCTRCGILTDRFPLSNRKATRTGVKVYLKSRCHDCHAVQARALYQLRKLHEPPDAGTGCECCGRVRQLYLDHDHQTLAFRGWLCQECNAGLSFFNDNVAGVAAALLYLTA